MASNSNYPLNTYPSEAYSGDGYGNPIKKTGVESMTYEVNAHNAQPNAELLDNRGAQTSLTPKQLRKYVRWQRVLRVCKILMKLITTLLSGYMFASMLYMTIKYQLTENTVRDGRTAWPKDAKLWPTFMLLASSGMTLIITVLTLMTDCCFKNKRAKGSWKLTVAKYVIHISVWITVSALYRYSKSLHGNNNDLWGWTCSDQSDNIQPQFTGVVNFGPLCTLQGSAWETSLAELVIKICFAVAHYYLYRKTRVGEKVGLANSVGGATQDFIENF